MLGRYRSRQQCAAVVMGAAGTDTGAHLPSTEISAPAAPELEQELQPYAESQPQLQLEPMPEAIELNVSTESEPEPGVLEAAEVRSAIGVHSAKAAAAAAAQMVVLHQRQRARAAMVEARIASTRRLQRLEKCSAAVRMASEHHQVPTFLHHYQEDGLVEQLDCNIIDLFVRTICMTV